MVLEPTLLAVLFALLFVVIVGWALYRIN